MDPDTLYLYNEYMNISPDNFAKLFRPKAAMINKVLELLVDDLHFISFPTRCLEESKITELTNSTAVAVGVGTSKQEDKQEDDIITLFNVVIVKIRDSAVERLQRKQMEVRDQMSQHLSTVIHTTDAPLSATTVKSLHGNPVDAYPDVDVWPAAPTSTHQLRRSKRDGGLKSIISSSASSSLLSGLSSTNEPHGQLPMGHVHGSSCRHPDSFDAPSGSGLCDDKEPTTAAPRSAKDSVDASEEFEGQEDMGEAEPAVSCHYCEMDVMELIMQQSALANELRTLYHDLRDGTNVSITINNYLKLHSQLTPHVSSPTTASSGLSSSFGEDLCRPYKTLLILAAEVRSDQTREININQQLDAALQWRPSDQITFHRTLQAVLQTINPMTSLDTLSVQLEEPLDEIYRHCIYYCKLGYGKIINAISLASVYIAKNFLRMCREPSDPDDASGDGYTDGYCAIILKSYSMNFPHQILAHQEGSSFTDLNHILSLLNGFHTLKQVIDKLPIYLQEYGLDIMVWMLKWNLVEELVEYVTCVPSAVPVGPVNGSDQSETTPATPTSWVSQQQVSIGTGTGDSIPRWLAPREQIILNRMKAFLKQSGLPPSSPVVPRSSSGSPHSPDYHGHLSSTDNGGVVAFQELLWVIQHQHHIMIGPEALMTIIKDHVDMFIVFHRS